VVRRYAHILKDVGAHQEGSVAGIRAESRTAGNLRRRSQRLERCPRLMAGCATAELPSAVSSSWTCLPSSTAVSIA
jgi:hypothetical protein